MEIIDISGTPKTPTIKFNAKQGKLEIKGKSIPENALAFYKTILESLEKYAGAPFNPIQVDIQLEYFGTASSKCILKIFKILEGINRNGTPVNINWFYEANDDDLREIGEDYQAMVNLQFNFKQL